MNPETTKTMKTPLSLAARALALSTILYQPSTALAQGSLTPPGAPAPTMKTLDQIEARTPISAAPYTITNPGSYYLTHSLTVSTGDGIDINTNDVTLDLNGFTIRSTAASATGTGILLSGSSSDITVLNGHIRGGGTNNSSGVFSGGGFTYGIKTSGAVPENVLVSRISVSGCRYDGISLSGQNSTVVESCTVRTVGGYGIMASTIKSCVAVDCGTSGIYGDQVSDSRGESTSSYGLYASATALNCYGSSSGSGTGLSAETAQNCHGYCKDGTGLSAETAQNCHGSSSSSHGLYATTALNCYGSTSGNSFGLNASTAQNCYGQCSGNGYGLYADYTAQNCYGYSAANGTGLSATTAQNCYGYSPSSSTGLNAVLANGCLGSSGTGTKLTFTHNVNSFEY